jgi:hypothetical protein
MKNNKLLKYFKTQEQFDAQSIYVEQGSTEDTYIDQHGMEIYGDPDIYPEHICFIEDTKTIFTHNTKYVCSVNNSGGCGCKETTILDILKFYNKTTKTFDESYINDNGDEILLSDENGYLLATDILQEMINNEIIFANVVNKQNISISNLNDKIVQVEEQINNIDGIKLLVNVTYDEICNLVNTNSLLPGQKYRITDYETTTMQSGTLSAGHNFDIIVTALTENTLSENASAIQHENDTYFINSDLSSWKLKYKLENDDINYHWVNSFNGKGIIYEMTDEFNNTLPYDFKNIMFCRYLVVNGPNYLIGKYVGWDGISNDVVECLGDTFDYFYTFSCYNVDNINGINNVYDSSLNIYSNNENKLVVTNNHYLPTKLTVSLQKGEQYILNDIAHVCEMNLQDGEYCKGINNTKIGSGCYNFTILDGCSNWEIKDNSKRIIISSGCNDWEIGNNANNILIGLNNSGWKIGNDCNNISTVSGCDDWKIGNGSFNISIYQQCSNWKIGSGCHDFNINSLTNSFEMLNGFNGLVNDQRTAIDLPEYDFRGQKISYQLFIGQNEYNVLTIWNPASPINYQYVERNTYWGGNFTTGTPHDILPNTYNEWTSKAPKAIRLVKPEENKTAEYILKFTVSDTGHSIVFENEIKWRNNDIPMWETGKTYEINIMNGLASYMEF